MKSHNLRLVRLLGQGAFGRVMLAVNLDDPRKTHAVKII
jgi:hypothetical protein